MSGLGVLALGVQSRRPATLLPYRGVLRVGTRNHAGPLGSGGRTFSSGTSLASPSVRSSFVLRDVCHSKSQIDNDSNTGRTPADNCCTWRPAGRRAPWRDGNPAESGSLCHLTVTANSQQKRDYCRFKRLVSRRIGVCIVSFTRLRSGVHQPDPPGLIHDDPRLLPPWRGSSFIYGSFPFAPLRRSTPPSIPTPDAIHR